jgi:cobalt/nickel transport system permease protein
MIPEWMMETQGGRFDPPPAFERRTRGRASFVKKTIDGVFKFFQEALITESFAKKDGLLRARPRVKLLSILAIVFAISVTGDIRLLSAVYLLTLLFARLSQIGIFFFIKRVWLFVPFFAGVIVIPVTLNVFLPATLIPYNGPLPDAHLGPYSFRTRST